MTTLVTRCPQCRAAFRVVAEQLHLRNGKVRCGVCKAVFDARAHQEQVLEPAAPEPAAPMPIVSRTAAFTPAASESAAPDPGRPPAPPRPVVQPAPPRVAPGEVPSRLPVSPRAATPDDLPAAHVEPWLSEDAVAPPVPAQAGRFREPVMGETPRPRAVATDKREPVLKAGATPPPMPPTPAGLPERRDPRLHEPVDQQHKDEGFDHDVDFGEGSGFDQASHEPQAHHVPEREQDHVPIAARPIAAQTGAARPEMTRPSAPPLVADRASSTPPFVARPAVVRHDGVQAHREPVMASTHDHVRESVHDTEDFVAHGPRSGYAVDLRGTRGRGLAQVFWSVCCVLAGLALVLQALWWWRTPIATYVPAMRPVYEAICTGMDCRVGYVRVPGLLSIESSSIQPQALSQPSDKAQHMTLSAVLRNRASHAQPWPAIELTLTDFANVVVARRMLLPAEYLGNSAPGPFAGNTEREIAVSLSVRGAPVSGYRLALFFP